MKTKFTPGPWVARNATLPNSRITRWVIIAPPDGFTIADTGTAEVPESQDGANARLIAAAPELLEALEVGLRQARASYEVTGGDHADGIGLGAIHIMELAIKKAKGDV